MDKQKVKEALEKIVEVHNDLSDAYGNYLEFSDDMHGDVCGDLAGKTYEAIRTLKEELGIKDDNLGELEDNQA